VAAQKRCFLSPFFSPVSSVPSFTDNKGKFIHDEEMYFHIAKRKTILKCNINPFYFVVRKIINRKVRFLPVIRTLDTNQFYNAHDDAIDIGYNSISSFHT
jgi:hypothetical protein